ncbi:hypothetical protein DPEC_G00114330 [Dallia pectoralis]|uniref:Uncharacterized protein n=1 Tax=Dallia pectoralis TaxID=75939 RepID=A0ACC2GU26_DALPE|nr:hypothetical protein DPEC_G00114330 [Dallia pectoralis]
MDIYIYIYKYTSIYISVFLKLKFKPEVCKLSQPYFPFEFVLCSAELCRCPFVFPLFVLLAPRLFVSLTSQQLHDRPWIVTHDMVVARICVVACALEKYSTGALGTDTKAYHCCGLLNALRLLRL